MSSVRFCYVAFWFLGILNVFTLPSFSLAGVFLENHLETHGCVKRTFTVTAYYSPTSHQLFYYKGDYDAEVKLNGEGMTGASGKPVFNGMLAAPKNYPFGTKIYLSGLGWGEVADRGGAIVNSGERGWRNDRLDVRMGRGEVGLIRALTFGVRNLEGWVCPQHFSPVNESGKKTSLGFDFSQIPFYKHFFTLSLFIQELWEGRNDPRVRELQRYLIRLGYLQSGMDTGFFGKQTKKAVCDFQVANKILSPTSPWCGYFGASTRLVLRDVLSKKSLLPSDLRDITSVMNIKKYAKSGTFPFIAQEIKEDKLGKTFLQAQNTIEYRSLAGAYTGMQGERFPKDTGEQAVYGKKNFLFTKSYTDGAYGGEIKLLQQRLALLGYDPGPINGRYTAETKKAVEAFQRAHNLIDADMGYLDEQTRNILNKIDWDFVEKNREFVRLVMHQNPDYTNETSHAF